MGTHLTPTEIVLLKQFSCPQRPEQRTHTRNQAELGNRFCSGGSQGGKTYGTSGILENILLEHLQEQTTNLHINKSAGPFCKTLLEM